MFYIIFSINYIFKKCVLLQISIVSGSAMHLSLDSWRKKKKEYIIFPILNKRSTDKGSVMDTIREIIQPKCGKGYSSMEVNMEQSCLISYTKELRLEWAHPLLASNLIIATWFQFCR